MFYLSITPPKSSLYPLHDQFKFPDTLENLMKKIWMQGGRNNWVAGWSGQSLESQLGMFPPILNLP
jgi:hypothetical protein